MADTRHDATGWPVDVGTVETSVLRAVDRPVEVGLAVRWQAIQHQRLRWYDVSDRAPVWEPPWLRPQDRPLLADRFGHRLFVKLVAQGCPAGGGEL